MDKQKISQSRFGNILLLMRFIGLKRQEIMEPIETLIQVMEILMKDMNGIKEELMH